VGGGGPVWRAKPKFGPHGPDIGGTCADPPENDSGGLVKVGERWVEGQGALEPGILEGGGVRHTKPKTGPRELDMGGACA
jgi:hypothetical protein